MSTRFETARETLHCRHSSIKGAAFRRHHCIRWLLHFGFRQGSCFNVVLPWIDNSTSAYFNSEIKTGSQFCLPADCKSAACTNSVCTGDVADGGTCTTNTGRAFGVALPLKFNIKLKSHTLQQSSVSLVDCATTTSTCTSSKCTGQRTVAKEGTCTADSGKSP